VSRRPRRSLVITKDTMAPRPEYCRSAAPSWFRTKPQSYTHPAAPRASVAAVKGGPVWERMLEAAKASGHPDPEKLADSMLASREKALAIKDARHHTNLVPYQAERGVPKPVKDTGAKCKATTLANKPCPYRATFCGFCSKHTPSAAVLKLARK